MGVTGEKSRISVYEFLSPFFSDESEAISLRSFKPKGAPENKDNKATKLHVTRADFLKNNDLQQQLSNLNKTRGIYFTPNAGGDTDDAIKRFSAFFAEKDDLTIEEQHAALDLAPIKPSIRVETRKSLHAYWLLKGNCTRDEWRDIQQRLIQYFGSDPTIKNFSRCMRLPGFNHVHYNEENKELSYKLVKVVEFDPTRRFTVEEMRSAFPNVTCKDNFQPISSVMATRFLTWDDLNAELRRRIMAHPTARINKDGWWHCKGICHNGQGDTAIMFNPATGAVKCMNNCEHERLLITFGLPAQPEHGLDEVAISTTFSRGDSPSMPFPELGKQALYGLAGEIVETIAPHTEAHPTALLLQILVAFGNCIGRNAYFSVEADRHYMNLFAVIVGETSKARKGTSWGHVLQIFQAIDETWAGRIQSGLSSGEGLIWAVHDPIEKQEPIKEKGRITGYQTLISDHGVSDKRLLVVEQEFASMLQMMTREGNVLSALTRQAWDRGNLRVMTKNSPARATGAHVSIIGHITKDELRHNLDQIEAANGFANRFLWSSSRRSNMLPEGGNLSPSLLNPLISSLHTAITYARGVREVRRDEDARALWYEIYAMLSAGHSGLFGAVTSRSEAQVMRLACIYALLDRSDTVRRVHLEAALVLWRYCEDSARYIFGDATGDRIADTILLALREAGESGLTRTDISNLFGRNSNAKRIKDALDALSASGLVQAVKEHTESGRHPERWFAVSLRAAPSNEINEINEKSSMHEAKNGLNSFNSFNSYTDEEFEERAAIMEFDGGMIRAEAEKAARLEQEGIPF
jgi:hypothetical protein